MKVKKISENKDFCCEYYETEAGEVVIRQLPYIRFGTGIPEKWFTCCNGEPEIPITKVFEIEQ